MHGPMHPMLSASANGTALRVWPSIIFQPPATIMPLDTSSSVPQDLPHKHLGLKLESIPPSSHRYTCVNIASPLTGASTLLSTGAILHHSSCPLPKLRPRLQIIPTTPKTRMRTITEPHSDSPGCEFHGYVHKSGYGRSSSSRSTSTRSPAN